MKIGRNDPCPCDSGKKFKKCCYKKQVEQDKSNYFQQEFDGKLGKLEPSKFLKDFKSDVTEMPYTQFCRLDNGDFLAKWANSNEKKLARGWTPKKLAKLPTEEITQKLRDFGITDSKNSILVQRPPLASAWELGEEWVNGSSVRENDQDRVFICLAACELWKRFLDNKPSIEMIEDWMQGGYITLQISNNSIECCHLWGKVWENSKPVFTPEMKSPYDADSIFKGSQSLGNWIYDYEIELLNAAQDDSKFAEIGIDFINERVELFPEQEEFEIVQTKCLRAEFLCLAGQQVSGEKLISEVVECWPNSAAGYAMKADIFTALRKKNGLAPDYKLAIETLEVGLTAAENPQDYDLARRLQGLKDSVNGK